MTTKKTSQRKKAPVYIFVDTNIFLDFYRGNNEASLSLLKKLENVKESIISTYQVEMEFKKNRQTVIQETLNNIKFDPKISLPAVFHDSATSKSLDNLKADAKKKLTIVEKRFLNILRSPSSTDVVFQTLEDIFHNPSEHVLTRDMDIRHKIKRLAWRRFILGYPPRKKNDTSTGDALNWEWLIQCGNTFPGKIIIVSRDGDFGTTIKNDSFLNDHLLQEYRERVGPRRRIQLTNKLSVALKELDVRVTKEEESAEKAQINDYWTQYLSDFKISNNWEDFLNKYLKDTWGYNKEE
jgi:predicted nucleic acid-binding protein